MCSPLFAAMFKGLVEHPKVGDLLAAAYAIKNVTGHKPSVSTLSQVCNGNANVPIEWAWALEQITGDWCFTEYRMSQRGERQVNDADPLMVAGEAAKEHGEAIEWSLRAARSSDKEDWSRAAVEHQQAADKHSEMAAVCESRANVQHIGKRAG